MTTTPKPNHEAYEIDNRRLSQRKRPELLVLARRLDEALKLEVATRNNALQAAAAAENIANAAVDAGDNLRRERDEVRDKVAGLVARCAWLTDQVRDLNTALCRPVNPAPVTATARLGFWPWLLSAGALVLAAAYACYLVSLGLLVWPW